MNMVKKYAKLFSMGLQSGLEYRTDFFLRIASGMFVIVVQCFMWTAVFRNSRSSVVYGYTFEQMITYVIIAALVAQMSTTSFQWEIAYDVKDGGLSKFLTQPVNYALYRSSSFLGKKISQIILLAVLTFVALVGCMFFFSFKLSLLRILLFLVFISIAIIIYFLFIKNNLIQYMEYKANFVAGILAASGFLLIRCVYVIFFYNSELEFNGFGVDQMMLYTGTFIIMTAIYTATFCDNFYKLPQNIQSGNLDLYITKPISLQFMATMRYFNFALPLPNFIVGVIMLVIAWRKLGIEVTIWRIVGYLFCLICATAITYSLFLFPQLLSFWIIKSDAVTQIADRAWDFNSMPMNIYGNAVQKIGVYFVPLFFISNFPTKFLLGSLTTFEIVWCILAPFIFFVLVRLFWNYAVKNYSSASS